VYPIVGNAMANNLTAHFAPWALEGATGSNNEHSKAEVVCRWQCVELCRCTPSYSAREKTFVKIAIRLLCAVPPIFLGAIAGSLNTIFSFAGLASFGLEFVFPALFQRYSVQVLKSRAAVTAVAAVQAEAAGERRVRWIDGARTPYSNVFSDRVFVFIVLAFGGVAVSFTFLQLIAPSKCAWLWWSCGT
jgi:hypothetical protein